MDGAPQTMTGQTLGNYRIVRKLGEGGMGVVYEAMHTALNRKAVVKMLRPEYTQDQELLARFFNEAKTAAQLRHPGIVEVFDFGRQPDGSAYIIMEFLDGESMADRILRDRQFSPEMIASLGRQMALAIGAAHKQGIVHRDLKPDNLFLLADRELAFGTRVKVLDFGIAKLLDSTTSDSVKTRAGAIMGTPSYMSPEQCHAQLVDQRSDVYSLGCILYEMACGRPPFVGEGIAPILISHLQDAPIPPRTMVPAIPPALEAAILQALAKQPEQRQQTCDDLAAQLERIAPPTWSGVTTPKVVAQTAVVAKKSSGGVWKILVALLVLGGAGAGIYVGTRNAGGGGGGATPSAPAAATSSASVALASSAAASAAPASSAASSAPVVAAAVASSVPAGGDAGLPAENPAADPAACVADAKACLAHAATLDPAKAAPLYEALCQASNADGCALQAEEVQQGIGQAADPQRALELYEKSCDQGSHGGCVNAGAMLESAIDGVPKDQKKALGLYDKGCQAGDGLGCDNLAKAVMHGHGTTVDNARALASFQKACELAFASGCTSAGFMTLQGLGTKKDPKAGLALFERGCEIGDALGCFDGARASEGGAGIPKNIQHAAELYDKACAAKNADACTNLGMLYETGDGVATSPSRAAELFTAGCEGGNGTGCFNLARYYAKGFSVARDEIKADALYKKACDLDGHLCTKPRP